MAWERSFEARVLKIREKELKYQKLNYTIEVCSWCWWISMTNTNLEMFLDALECHLVGL